MNRRRSDHARKAKTAPAENRSKGYPGIGSHGIIGNLRTAALIALDGSIDWYCLPRFDSPSVFGALLDRKKGGRFRIAPAGGNYVQQQYYWPSTNVLVTRFRSSQGAAEITDFMPMDDAAGRDRCRLFRHVQAVRGSVSLRLEFQPAFNYGRDSHQIRLSRQGAVFASPSLSLALSTSLPLDRVGNGLVADFTLAEGEARSFLLQIPTPGGQAVPPMANGEAEAALTDTLSYWQKWISKCNYRGRWREMVNRSALTLELMVYEPTGAIVAAPTCSLPERIGGERNWNTGAVGFAIRPSRFTPCCAWV